MMRTTVHIFVFLTSCVLTGRLHGQGFPPTTASAPTDTSNRDDNDNSKLVQHIVDQFAGSEVWVTPPRHQVGVAKLGENRCSGTDGFWLRFGRERVKDSITEFVIANYLSIRAPFSAVKPMGIVADVTLRFIVGDSQITAMPFHPITSAKELVVQGYDAQKSNVETSVVDANVREINQWFLFALPKGSLARLNGAKVRLQGPQRTCDGQLDERAQHALAALLEKGN
jgi:hypothetical protein